jgi:hypothetical protein
MRRRDQRQHQQAVRDRAAERALRTRTLRSMESIACRWRNGRSVDARPVEQHRRGGAEARPDAPGERAMGSRS